MKKISLIILLVLAMPLALSGCFMNTADSKAIITIKSDAIIELIIDERGRVASVAPLNAAAEVVVIKLDIINDSVNNGVRKLVVELAKLGYVNAVNRDIFVDTLAIDPEEAQNYNRTIFNAIKNFNKSINILSYDFKLEERDYRSFVRNTKGFENLDLLQYRLISGVKRYRNDMTYKLGARMTTDELVKELTSEYAFAAQFHSYTLAAWFKKTIDAKVLDYGLEIAELAGGAFKQHYDCFINLNNLTKKIVKNKQTSKLSLDTINKALNVIGVSDIEEVNAAYLSMSNNSLGHPTIASVEAYIDNMYIAKVFANQAAQELFEKQIDQCKVFYLLEYMELTEEEKQEIVAILPASITYQYYDKLNTIEDIYYLLKIIAGVTKENYQAQYAQSTIELQQKFNLLAASINDATKDTLSEHIQLIDKEYERLLKENQRRREIYQKES